jgi:hypothetical protein
MVNTEDLKTKVQLFESVNSELAHEGFILQAGKERFVRSHPGGITDLFQLVCLDAKPSGYRVQPNVGIRIETVEDIFHISSDMEPQYQKETPTLGGAVGNILTGSSRSCEFRLASLSDVTAVTTEILRVFREFALPYFDKYSSLPEIDAELNDKPQERTPNRGMSWLRVSTGIIVARLVGRDDYLQLVEMYEERMRRENNGFYLKRFQRLLESLEQIEPGIGLSKETSRSVTG